MTESKAVPEKLAALRRLFKELRSVLVCYSGGVDSAFVLKVACEELGDQAVGLTAVSPSLSARERHGAVSLAESFGASHRLVESQEMADAGYVKNDVDRCFHCKTELYRIAAEKSRQWGLEAIVNGANVDDLGDYRPGLQAARDAGVRSPLLEVGFTKADVRAAAKEIGLPVWDKPAAACLASRIPYGTRVTEERLAQVGGFEETLRQLGFRQLRVRYHDHIARIELGLGELAKATDPAVRERIVVAGKEHGFKYITLDLAGYRTGSHNEVLQADGSLRVIGQ